MGAVKNLAIELEGNMQWAADLASQSGDATLAYRLGLLEACRLIGEDQVRYIGDAGLHEGPCPFDVLQSTWRSIFEAADYLREVASRRD